MSTTRSLVGIQVGREARRGVVLRASGGRDTAGGSFQIVVMSLSFG